VPGGNPALIAGYRVLRRLASSDRADLYVGVAPARSTVPGRGVHVQETDGSASPVVLKVFHPETEGLSIEREVRALTTLTSGRLTSLFDVGTLSDGRTCLVLEQLTGGALSCFLEGRRNIHPGEAVTILAPVAAALAELQAIGLIHPAVSLSTILFDSSGRPVLTGLGRLQALPAAGGARPEALDAVHGRLAQVVRAVLDQVEGGVPAKKAVRDLDRWCAVSTARSAARTPGELEHLLFDWAEAAPVRLGKTGDAGSRPQTAGDWLRRAVPDNPAGSEPGEAVHVAAAETLFREMLGSLLSRARTALRRLREGNPGGERKALRGQLRFRRGPLVLAVLVAVVSTGLAVTALGPGGSSVTAGAQPEAPTETAGASGIPVAAPVETTAAASDRAAVRGDDPVAAIQALLRIRSGCLGEVSVICLDGVHQRQSAALAGDSYTLRMIQQGGGAPQQEDLSSWKAVLEERTGDVALVTLQAPDEERQPASVLMVKGEAGWRIREIIDF